MSTGAGVGVAANIVGGELQGWAALLDKWAMGDVYRQQAAQQRRFQQQAGGIIDQRIGGAGADAAQQQMQAGQQNRQALYQSVQNTPMSVQPTPLGSLQNNRNNAYATLLGGQRAKLGSYGDWLQNQWLQNQQTQRGLNQVLDSARGSANVFPIQLYAAQHSMDDLAAIGQAISSIGGGAANYTSLFNSTPQQSQSRYAGLDPGSELSSGQQASSDYAGEIRI